MIVSERDMTSQLIFFIFVFSFSTSLTAYPNFEQKKVPITSNKNKKRTIFDHKIIASIFRT